MTSKLPDKKWQDILRRIEQILNIKTMKIRDFASFFRIYTKAFERSKYLALLNSGDNYDATMTITNSFL